MKVLALAPLMSVWCACATNSGKAQVVWAPASLPGSAANIQQVVASSDQQTVYYGGSVDLGGGWQWTNAVFKYTEGDWDTLGTLNGMIQSIVVYHDTLLVTGYFDTIDDTVAVDRIAFHDGSRWHPYGSLAPDGARRLRVLDDTLYAVGGFDTCDGLPCTGIAKRVGGQWLPVGMIPDAGAVLIDVIKYQGELVVIGSVDINETRRIARFVNGEWVELGPGILGGFSSAHSLAVYGDDLYVGGQISLAAGNAGQDIMRWDGQAFHAVGSGLQRELGDLSTFSDCRSLVVHDGLLFAGGGFRYAGGAPANGVAIWNGTEWCGIGGDLTSAQGFVNSMAFLGDTLFVACGDTADGQAVNLAAKYIGEGYQGPCTSTLDVVQSAPPAEEFRLRVGIGFVEVELPLGCVGSGVLFDGIGRSLDSRSGSTLYFATAALSTGAYFIHVEGFKPRRLFVE